MKLKSKRDAYFSKQGIVKGNREIISGKVDINGDESTLDSGDTFMADRPHTVRQSLATSSKPGSN